MKKSALDYILKVRLPITLFVIALTFVITFYVSRQERDSVGYAPIQPINYSHKLHAGDMGIDCEYCHTGVSEGRYALVPSVNICMNCHTISRKDRPEIIKLTKYYESGEPVPWKRIHKVPEYAYFNHSVHVNTGIQCETCHGNISKMEVVSQVRSFTMTACLDCHRDPEKQLPYLKKVNKGPENCAACHR
ncbi:MAG: cytochrome c family protein [Melioribacteraceae bacterium]|nr:cytochrome c family protein [Melioribacteraceae bacterium]MCF8354403.1 cytochrome c family protein [Melioribacteraceae bacterium]MCF8393000.1 cytochrome c family protein [Melioribacteraceae bacterium]MCF8417257.1 cytochrome c family protein [Melioribacteraceae bacterium]